MSFRIPCVLILFILLTAVSEVKLARTPVRSKSSEREALYLPNGAALEFLSLGYRNALADLLWVQTVIYFAKHLNGDRVYTWLAHRCDLVVKLNPRARHVFEFGGVILAWESSQPEKAVELLSKGINYFPQSWKLFYLRSIVRMHFLQDEEGARADLMAGAQLPEAPAVMAQAAAKRLTKTSGAELAVDFLRDLLSRTSDPSSREGIARALRDARYALDLSRLEGARVLFEQRSGRALQALSELVEAGIVKELGPDPYGGQYQFDASQGKFMGSGKSNLLSR